jgi:hypothetical protein
MREGEGQYEQEAAVSDGPSTLQQVHGYPSYSATSRPTHISGVVLEGASHKLEMTIGIDGTSSATISTIVLRRREAQRVRGDEEGGRRG